MRGDDVRWFIDSAAKSTSLDPASVLVRIRDVMEFSPDAVLVPGNQVPPFFPGLKVQVFHGFGIEKKGHFRIRNMFHLYCTHGPLTTIPFQELAKKHNNFVVRETGWPKMDPLFAMAESIPAKRGSRVKEILYAPTFSPSLTSAHLIFPEIKALIAERPEWNWRVKFHPKMAQELRQPWLAIQAENYEVVSGGEILPLLVSADVMLTDTSSVAAEFMLLDKPVVTYKNRKPGPHLLNALESSEVPVLLARALLDSASNEHSRGQYIADMHPFSDGKSAVRVLDAVKESLDVAKCPKDIGLKPLPWLAIRRFKYWRRYKSSGLN